MRSLLTALLLVAVAGLGGCAACVPEAAPASDAGDGSGDVIESRGCSAKDIQQSPAAPGDVAETCARCTEGGTSVDICGEVVTARCSLAENDLGDACRVCTVDGTDVVLFDGCAPTPPPTDALICSSSPPPASSPAADDPQGLVSECQVCTDETGFVVTTVCAPPHDRCVRDVDGCTICLSGDVVVSRTCPAPDVAPRLCQQYGNADGSCIDCYDDTDQLVLHSCTRADAPKTCNEIVERDRSCWVCSDPSGAATEAHCQTRSQFSVCDVLSYQSQTCIVCVDELGEVPFYQCQTGCQGTGCPAPPECAFESDPNDGALCRTCPAGAGRVERQCVDEAVLVCINTIDDTSSSGTCTVCTDENGIEVYRDCGGGEIKPFPACADEIAPDGSVCHVCVDALTGQQVARSCDNGTSCYDTPSAQLIDDTGAPVVVQNAAVTADCSVCDTRAGEAVLEASAQCVIPSACSMGSFDDPAACTSSVSLLVAPLSCGNPWQLAGYGQNVAAQSHDELLAVLSFFAAEHGVVLLGIAQLGAVASNCAADDCACSRGDTLQVVAADVDATLVRELLAPLLIGCNTDADCPAGFCADGTCG